ncbi:hypothetical protein EB118_19920 [bacterium]|nr:hypothetical protein [Chitinophagia bacterium]NDC95766.1 hypothetical protein [bacterium]NDD85413.1 hypothetical protein [bacterium]NDG32330.1 hypothetical protein [bacterium]
MQVVHELTRIGLTKLYLTSPHLIKPMEKRMEYVKQLSKLHPHYFVVQVSKTSDEIFYKWIPVITNHFEDKIIVYIDIIVGKYTHATVLLIDTVNRTAERFDPDEPIDTNIDDFVSGALLGWYKLKDFTYYPARCIGSPQTSFRLNSKYQVNSTCQYWTLWYLYKRLTTNSPPNKVQVPDEDEFIQFIRGIHSVQGVLHPDVDKQLREAGIVAPYHGKQLRITKIPNRSLIGRFLMYLLKVV